MVMATVCVVALKAASPQTGSRSQAAPSQAWQQALVNRYCVTCHNSRLRTGGLSLDIRDATKVGDAPEIWEHVVRKLRAGAMPPSPSPRPDPATYDRFTTWLESELDRAAAANLNPGRTEAFHRLNRTEYHNAIRDLLDLEIDVADLLPADSSSYGFDNIAGALGFSPALLERYLDAARKISRAAVGRPATSPAAETFRLANDLPQDEWVDGLPFGTRGGAAFRYTFPGDGDYALRVRLARDASGTLAAFTVPHTLVVSLDRTPVQTFMVGGPPPADAPRSSEAYRTWLNRQRNVDQNWEFRTPVKAGPHEIQITFVKKTDAYPETLRQPYERPYTSTTGGDTRYEPYVGSVTVTGPYGAASGASPVAETPSRRRIFVCRPVSEAAEDQAVCARQILSSLARRAYRRPLTPADLDAPLGFFEKGREQEGFEAGIEMALRWLLASPQFVLRVERDPVGVAAATNYPITDLELASRLSFFLWSSIPDDELLDAAAAGRLHDPQVLERQTRRMLADDRSRALVTSFASQWLYLRNVPAVVPDADLFPDFGDDLRTAMQRETELFVESIIREDRSALDFLTADYTFVNERLARHYGIPHVFGSEFRRVQVPDEARRGLLGQASILAVTAYPNRTSPVLRGKWVLQNLLGTPPPSPPPNVPALEATTSKSSKPLSMREAMELHRANPACASCHRVMDPPGFALEQFDAVGRLRTLTETGTPINASGALPDGTTFEGAAGLRAALEQKPERFVSTLTEKLMIYALGRGLEYYDAPTVRTITRDAAHDDYRFSSLVVGIVKSPPFRMRRTQP
jgi:mono/diheme cytochrome c family protein